uniref:Uncharacterized protein n=1 Tax=Anopheles stephensi TaxID=30069 RepID=A0A182YNL1_ANOST
MPCEKCNVKFGIITRKKSCYECHRLFCRNCLTKRQERFLCPNCTIFTKRPLSRIDLAQLKVKDLIFYLQSKHISTSGCVEKDDLINLVIAHVNSGGSSPRTPGSFSATSSNTESASGGSSRYGSFYRNGTKNCTNTFDQIKNTCQNLFSTFSDKLNGDVPENGRPSTGFATQEEQRHIFTQPRFGSNNVYHSVDPSVRPGDGASHYAPNATDGADSNQRTEPGERPAHFSSGASSGTTSGADSSAASSSFSSPSREACSPLLGDRLPTATGGQTQAMLDDRIESILALETGGTGCECCTDDEDDDGRAEVTVPKERCDSGAHREEDMAPCSKQSRRSVSQSNLLAPQLAGPSADTSATTTKHASHSQTPSSSFDDLLADGEGSSSNADQAIAQDTLAVTDTDALATTVASIDDTDQWQIVHTSDTNGGGTLEAATNSELPMTDATNEATTANEEEESSDSIDNSVEIKSKAPPMLVPVLGHSPSQVGVTGGAPLITRRRSDSYLLSAGCGVPLRQHGQVGMGAPVEPLLRQRAGTTRSLHTADAGPTIGAGDTMPTSSHPANPTTSTTHGMCFRCGKRRNGIRRQLKKFRKQLETATVPEVEKRRQLEAFLNYLERRSKGSFELTDSESITEEASVSVGDEGATGGVVATALDMRGPSEQQAHSYPKPSTAQEGPICTNLYSSGNQDLANMKQIKLSDIKESADLDVLSVKQLKGILMVNRVDFKGCCEKAELRERVLRLWRDYKSIPSIEKLPSDDLCKICMDAPIECVILECGHMTTCTACGKVLSECPICRQYIVRVVRFFRA